MLSEIALNGILDIIDTPFVSSTIPEKRPFAKLIGIFRVSNTGDTISARKSKTLVLLSIEIITLKSITNPPIIIIVFIELIILLCKIAPKFLKDGVIFLSK